MQPTGGIERIFQRCTLSGVNLVMRALVHARAGGPTKHAADRRKRGDLSVFGCANRRRALDRRSAGRLMLAVSRQPRMLVPSQSPKSGMMYVR